MAFAASSQSDADKAQALATAYRQILAEVDKRVVGQSTILHHLLITLFARGHALLVGMPGLAKTLLIHTLAAALELHFNRIQFTPDLMPADITGTDVLEKDLQGQRSFRFIMGPVFCNLLLADEVNRTPPKTQAALLQAMQEGRVTAGGRTFVLQPPFHVFATQNPVEQEGTYPLPEAQLDRFMMMLKVDYPSASEEEEIVRSTTGEHREPLRKILAPEAIVAYQELVRRVPADAKMIAYAVALVRASRPTDASAPALVKKYVAYGAGPRAAQHLLLAAKAKALLEGRAAVDRTDLSELALPVLRHRVLVNFQAEAEHCDSDQIISGILTALPR